jgi:hypothetical protein
VSGGDSGLRTAGSPRSPKPSACTAPPCTTTSTGSADWPQRASSSPWPNRSADASLLRESGQTLLAEEPSGSWQPHRHDPQPDTAHCRYQPQGHPRPTGNWISESAPAVCASSSSLRSNPVGSARPRPSAGPTSRPVIPIRHTVDPGQAAVVKTDCDPSGRYHRFPEIVGTWVSSERRCRRGSQP